MEKRLLEYAERHTSPEPQLLKDLTQRTIDVFQSTIMLAGPYQGRLLSMIAHMIRPQRVLEIGTFTGYSSICFAEGLADNGKLIAIDIDSDVAPIASEFWQEAGISEKCELITGNAREIVPTLDVTFDLVYIDADKPAYRTYFDLVFEKVRKGGFILFDNVFLEGHVLDESPEKEAFIRMQELNDFIQKDERLENIMLPVRDGLMLVRKL